MNISNICEKELQLLGVASLYIASKYEEVYVNRVEEFAKTTDNAYSCCDILGMESKILNVLCWDVNHSTPCDFMNMMMMEWDAYTNM